MIRSQRLVGIKKVLLSVTDLSLLKTVCHDSSSVALATLSCKLLRKIDCCCQKSP